MPIIETFVPPSNKQNTISNEQFHFLLDIIGKHFLNVAELQSGKITVTADEYIDRSEKTTARIIQDFIENIRFFTSHKQASINSSENFDITFPPFTNRESLYELKEEIYKTCMKHDKDLQAILTKVQKILEAHKDHAEKIEIPFADITLHSNIAQCAHKVLWCIRYYYFESAIKPELKIDFMHKQYIVSL